jgi:2,3-bisphosphoglycerate-dependent phosphoglycerate mutase
MNALEKLYEFARNILSRLGFLDFLRHNPLRRRAHHRDPKHNYLVLLRHGQSKWNLENRFTGFKDIDLTEDGIIEARVAGQKLKEGEFKFDEVFTSTLKRANRTARIALEKAGMSRMIKKMIPHDDLRERDYGALTGLNKDETRNNYGDEQVLIWRRSYDVPPPGGESLRDVV